MSKNSELAEQVFAPGNLVYGGSFRSLESYIEKGIRPASAVDRTSIWGIEDCICFALLSELPLPNRYKKARHFAPNEDRFSLRVGFVVSCEDLLDTFPDQVYAIGEFFWDRGYREERKLYHYNPRMKTVFGIPIKSLGNNPYPDEVRVFPKNVQEAAVTKEMWRGLVVARADLIRLRQVAVSGMLEIPVFSPGLDLLTMSLV